MHHYILFLSSVFFTMTVHAGPIVQLCIESDCKHPANIEISDATWSKVRDLHKSPLQSDKDEQDNIANSISLIEVDVFTSLAKHLTKDGNNAAEIFSGIELDNKLRNIKRYLGILLDKHLVTRHVLRNTIKLKSWAGLEKSALLLQSLDNSELYILKIVNRNLGNNPVIMPYRQNPPQVDDTIIRQHHPAANR